DRQGRPSPYRTMPEKRATYWSPYMDLGRVHGECRLHQRVAVGVSAGAGVGIERVAGGRPLGAGHRRPAAAGEVHRIVRAVAVAPYRRLRIERAERAGAAARIEMPVADVEHVAGAERQRVVRIAAAALAVLERERLDAGDLAVQPGEVERAVEGEDVAAVRADAEVNARLRPAVDVPEPRVVLQDEQVVAGAAVTLVAGADEQPVAPVA